MKAQNANSHIVYESCILINVKNITRTKNQIKSLLHYNGITLPPTYLYLV
jgi:hypothetical protein